MEDRFALDHVLDLEGLYGLSDEKESAAESSEDNFCDAAADDGETDDAATVTQVLPHLTMLPVRLYLASNRRPAACNRSRGHALG